MKHWVEQQENGSNSRIPGLGIGRDSKTEDLRRKDNWSLSHWLRYNLLHWLHYDFMLRQATLCHAIHQKYVFLGCIGFVNLKMKLYVLGYVMLRATSTLK